MGRKVSGTEVLFSSHVYHAIQYLVKSAPCAGTGVTEPLGACCLDLMLVDRRGWMSRRCFSWWRGPCGSAPVPMCFGQLSFSICFGVVAGSFAGSCQSFLGPGCIPGGRAVGQVRAGRLGSADLGHNTFRCVVADAADLVTGSLPENNVTPAFMIAMTMFLNLRGTVRSAHLSDLVIYIPLRI